MMVSRFLRSLLGFVAGVLILAELIGALVILCHSTMPPK